MKNESSPTHEPTESRRNLQWKDLSQTGRIVACVVFFLVYLSPAHDLSTATNYPWYISLLLQWPWFVIALSIIFPRLNRIPVNPRLFGPIAVFISSIVVGVANPEGRFPEWATASAIAGLAAIMTGPMLRGYDERETRVPL